MPSSFVPSLHDFAMSVDIVDDAVFKRLEPALRAYASNVLRANFFEVQTDGQQMASGDRALSTRMDSSDLKTVTPIKDANGNHTGQTTYAYDRNVKLWVTSENHSLSLGEAPDRCIDSWNRVTDLPKYWNFAQQQNRTSVILPLPFDQRTIGFVNFEFDKHYTCTKAAKTEFSLLAEALGALVGQHRVYTRSVSNSGAIVARLAQSITPRRRSMLECPAVFLATSGNADPKVRGCIREVLGEFEERRHLSALPWYEAREPGDINRQIVESILSSDFGICYFSEPAGAGYVDNPNVMFEAGMLHALTALEIAPMRGWIAIREKNSPPCPFDLAAHRQIIVSRNGEQDTPNTDSLTSELRAQLDELLGH